MTKSFRFQVAFSVAAVLALLGCSSKEAAAPASPPAAAPVAASGLSADASIIDLMKDTISPTAETLWNAVGSVSTTEGTKDLAPSSDAEWAALRAKVLLLKDATAALTTEGRVVGHPGQKLKDPPGPGDFTPEQAQAAITKDRSVFVAFATAMQGVGDAYLAAIDKKNVDALGDAGGKLDEVCEACHKRFWYPEGGTPTVP